MFTAIAYLAGTAIGVGLMGYGSYQLVDIAHQLVKLVN